LAQIFFQAKISLAYEPNNWLSSNAVKNRLKNIVARDYEQGCQIFIDTKYQNGDNIANCHNIYQIAIK
jgi:hypothetical protein